MSPDEFAEELTKRLPPYFVKKNDIVIEMDISKFDKSQLIFVLNFECKFMKYFGVEDYIIDLWYESHFYKKLSDSSTKVRMYFTPQRNSGDAATFFFNTIFLISTLCCTYNLKDCFSIFAGDDSCIFGNPQIKTTELRMSLQFNLETKIYYYKNYYFCSRFLIKYFDKWLFISDPLKVIIKLGRKDLRNFMHVEEYRVSLMDNIAPLKNQLIHDLLSEAISERYGRMRFLDFSAVFSTLYSIVSDKNEFKNLYHHEFGTYLSYDPSYAKFD